MGRKLALVIGNSRYEDPGLARLTTADVDVRDFAGVLRTPEIGEFDEVVELPDEGLAVVRRSIARFFSQAKKDDLLLFYFSGHGVKDDHGHLYLAVRDTEPHLLAGTSIEAAFITAQMDRSYSKRQVLILDCCHSGAFAHGTKAGDAQVVGTAPAFEGTGYGRVVLTATDSTQYAWQGDQIIGESDKSVFTHYLLEGLKTGKADRDGDGLITIDELYDYVYERVVSETPKQTPGKWSYKQQGDIVIARNPHPLARTAELPLEIRALLESPLSRLRTEAVSELAGLLHGRHPGLALAARRALEYLLADDSRKVSAGAEEALASLLQQEEAARAAQEAERVRREIEQLEAEASERRQKVGALIARADQATSHEAAIETLSEALELDPGHEAASQLLARHTAALEQMAAERARQEEVAAARRRIEDLLQWEDLNQAEQVLAQAEKDSGDLSAFEELRRRLRHKQHDRLASEVVEGARREFAAGRHDLAVTALERFHPPHPLVSRALGDLTIELERLGRQEEERRRSEAERLAREQEIASLRDAARSYIERQQFVEALRALHALRRLDPDATGFPGLEKAAEAGRVAAEEAERRRQESQQKLAVALKRFRRRDFARALALAEEACGLDPQNSAASGLRDEIQQTLNEDAAAVDTAESVQQTRGALRPVLWFLRLSRPLQVGLAAVLFIAGFVLFGLPFREGSPRENSESPPAPTVPAQEAAPSPAQAVPPLQSETLPASMPSPVAPPSKPGARDGPLRSIAPGKAGQPGTSQPPSQLPAAAGPVPSDLEARIARLLADGDRLMDARNYDGALAAYEEASRFGSAAGRERAEKVSQEKTAQVRQRLNRAGRLMDTGGYEEALRAIDEALALDPKSGEASRLRQRVLDAQSFERALRRQS